MASGSNRPRHSREHTSIIRISKPARRTNKPKAPYEPSTYFPPQPVVRKKGRMGTRAVREVGEHEELILEALRLFGGWTHSGDITLPGRTARQISYSLGILRENRKVEMEYDQGTGRNLWRAVV